MSPMTPPPLQAICAMDQMIMHELAKYVPDLANLAAGGRSDAMCAVYPGKGSRFARHIDNSANDGRRLTSLLYMNNGWVPAMGGCLRLHSPGERRDPTTGARCAHDLALFNWTCVGWTCVGCDS